jgi:hypothetical protein
VPQDFAGFTKGKAPLLSQVLNRIPGLPATPAPIAPTVMLRPNPETVVPAAPRTGPGKLSAVRCRRPLEGAAVALDQIKDVHFQASLKNCTTFCTTIKTGFFNKEIKLLNLFWCI